MSDSERRLDAAVERGIISAEQAAAIRALRLDEGRPGSLASPAAAFAHLRRRFGPATIAYILGAIIVVVAMFWFLGERWNSLGRWGVIATCTLYAGIFLGVGQRLYREGFPIARGVAVLLAIAMVPPIVTSLNAIAGWFDPIAKYGCYDLAFAFWDCRGEELVMELATLLAALVALRWIRFGPLMIPIAAIAVRLLFHIADGIGFHGYGDSTSGWVWAAGASILAATAYATDRLQDGDEDFALWLHLAATSCLAPASWMLLDRTEWYRHFMLPGAFVAFAAALLLRRFNWLLVGMAWFVVYVVWLAADVFEHTPAFPIVLAALGIAVIIATVWVQRNSAMLIERFGTVTSDGRPRFPGGVPLLLAPALVALLMLPVARAEDADRQAEMRWQSRYFARKYARERVEQRKKDEAEKAVKAQRDPLADPPAQPALVAPPRRKS